MKKKKGYLDYFYTKTKLRQLKRNAEKTIEKGKSVIYNDFFIIEIENINLFFPCSGSGLDRQFHDQVLRKLIKAFDNRGFIGKLDTKKILIIVPVTMEKSSIQQDLPKLLKSGIPVGGQMNVIPIFKIGHTVCRKLKYFTKAVQEAEMALFFASYNSKSRHFTYNTSLRKQYQFMLYISTHIEYAIQQGELSVVFQPQYDCSNRILGFEALVRWESPDYGIISPENFIPVLEKTGRITHVGNYVLTQSCAFLNECASMADNSLYISVNFSPFEIVRHDFISEVIHIINKYQINPEQIKIELTENSMVEISDLVLKRIEELTRIGFHVVIDDFGKGYSSLAELKELPVSSLKIDKSFLTNVPNHSYYVRILEAMVIFFQSINLDFVVEGVETNDQLSLLRKMGCNKFQGYYLSKPLQRQQALQLLDQERVSPAEKEPLLQ